METRPTIFNWGMNGMRFMPVRSVRKSDNDGEGEAAIPLRSLEKGGWLGRAVAFS